MSISGERTHLKLITVGDFDPQSDKGIEYDLIGRGATLRRRARLGLDLRHNRVGFMIGGEF